MECHIIYGAFFIEYNYMFKYALQLIRSQHVKAPQAATIIP